MKYGHEIAKKVILGLPPQKDSSRRQFPIKCLLSQKVIKGLFGLVDFCKVRFVESYTFVTAVAAGVPRY